MKFQLRKIQLPSRRHEVGAEIRNQGVFSIELIDSLQTQLKKLSKKLNRLYRRKKRASLR
jgi:hypothetical protein